MKFGVVTFPGSNCDHDMIDALRELGQQVYPLWHKDQDISLFNSKDCIVLPGGFSYGDYLRCGALARFSPMMESVIRFAGKGGKVLGVCNGFQILCESGLLPGALLLNGHRQFLCKNVHIISNNSTTPLTKDIVGKALKIPIAHGEGRYYADDATLRKLEENDQVLFRYCDENGIIDPASNPNGSIDNIAGITNENKNVFGMMPHPERAAFKSLNNTDGISIFMSLIMNSVPEMAM
jgi:phosphoribosylformylglycinamidine synthase subunit PurQ / glutaminase